MLLQYKMYDLKFDTMYYFRVQAHNEVGAGLYTKFINVSITNENPVPLLLFCTSHDVRILDIDLQIDFELNYGPYKSIAYSALEHKFYGITYYTAELMTWEFNTSAFSTKPNFVKIVDVDIAATELCIDWVARNLYWVDYRKIMKLDLISLQMGIVKYDTIRKTNGNLFSFNVLPSKGYI
ncbi:proto-oncogene tyrosine-protein kinase ros [Lasius niger]|uniref:Proto-oncogene tyrosine-protein kinase ros n=1 Tax=Lasius niger TaxID=67767 RepID=A0A0J7JW90_LASNI|nr:proto-oncogene tyrosine-protein kinase ros [Lasius niger]